MMTSAAPYDADFYRRFQTRRRHAAPAMLSICFEHLPVRSVADVGCGIGTWLAAALELGAGRAVGFDGPWVDPAQIEDKRIEFRPQSLEEPVTADERFDLAISLEVAEHLGEARAESFVEDLCALSDCVMFGDAIPLQPGTAHVNCQWQSWWAELFERRGYLAFDAFRPRVWNDAEIPEWYRQNTFLYLSPEARARGLAAGLARPAIMDVVHPELATRRVAEASQRRAAAERNPGTRERLALAAGLPRHLLRRMRRRLSG